MEAVVWEALRPSLFSVCPEVEIGIPMSFPYGIFNGRLTKSCLPRLWSVLYDMNILMDDKVVFDGHISYIDLRKQHFDVDMILSSNGRAGWAGSAFLDNLSSDPKDIIGMARGFA